MLRDKEPKPKQRAHERLTRWIRETKVSRVGELKAFAVKLFQGAQAVVSAMILPCSQGQTEGRVNKLKLVKRSMYGRGNFDLLRQRILYVTN